MTNIRNKGEEIRRFIVSQVQKHPGDIAKQVARHFGISRQAANRYFQQMVESKALVSRGATRNKRYRLRTLREWRKDYEINTFLTESAVWFDDIKPLLEKLPDNALDIWYCGFTDIRFAMSVEPRFV